MNEEEEKSPEMGEAEESRMISSEETTLASTSASTNELLHSKNQDRIAANDEVHSLDISKVENVHSPNKAEGLGGLNALEAKSANLSIEVHQPQGVTGTPEGRTPASSVDSPDIAKPSNFRGIIDTAAPFESVKQAVSKFGGIVDWKAHKSLTIERRKNVEVELEKIRGEILQLRKRAEEAERGKALVLEELENTKKIVEELKLNLEKARTEEALAKQDSELAQLRAEEVERGITADESFAAKAQLDIAKARHEAAIIELKSVKEEFESLREDYVHLVSERDVALKKAGEATKASHEIEKTVDDLTLELMTTKESLEAAHAAHLEAEELQLAAVSASKSESSELEKDLKQAESRLDELNGKILKTNDLRSKLDSEIVLLSSLKDELAASKEVREKLTDNVKENSVQTSLLASQKELEEVKTNIEKANNELICLRALASSLPTYLERDNDELTTTRQKKGIASGAASSLQAEFTGVETELELIQAKSVAKLAREELRKAKEEAEQAKAGARATEVRLQAALKEIEAAKASERLALAAIKALEETGQAEDTNPVGSPTMVTLNVTEYYELSKKAHEAEELSNNKVIEAVEQIKLAKKSESNCLESLEQANKKLEAEKEELRIATQNAQDANEGKLAVEQELRNWRAEHEQQRKIITDHTAQFVAHLSPPTCCECRQRRSFGGETALTSVQQNSKLFKSASATESTAASEQSVKKKRLFFPRFVAFLAKKKAQSLK